MLVSFFSDSNLIILLLLEWSNTGGIISKCLKLELSNKSSRTSSVNPGFSFLSSKWTFLNLKLHTGAKASPYLLTSYSSLHIINYGRKKNNNK